MKLSVASLLSVVALLLGLQYTSTAAAADGDRPPQKLAIVNVSFIFENYVKVPDLQRKIDETHKSEENTLQQRFKELAQRNKDLDQFMNNPDASPDIFDKIQALRRDQYLFDRDRRRYDDTIQQEYTKGMKDILTDIRVAIRAVADQGNFDLVLRSPDADDPSVNEGDKNGPQNPAASDNKTWLELNGPKSVGELIERFNRNPVLYGAKPTDITKGVLSKLNDDYLKRSKGTTTVTAPNNGTNGK